MSDRKVPGAISEAHAWDLSAEDLLERVRADMQSGGTVNVADDAIKIFREEYRRRVIKSGEPATNS